MEEQKNKKWDVTTERYVACIKLVNIEQQLRPADHNHALSLMKQGPNATKKYKDLSSKVEVIGTTNSIIVYSQDNSNDSLTIFTEALFYLLEDCINSKYIAKGGAALGHATIDQENRIFNGQAIENAGKIGETICFMGIIFHSSIKDVLNDIDSSSSNKYMEEIIYSFTVQTEVLESDNRVEYRGTALLLKPLDKVQITPYYESRSNLENEIKDLAADSNTHTRQYIDDTLKFINYAYPECNKETIAAKTYKVDWDEDKTTPKSQDK